MPVCAFLFRSKLHQSCKNCSSLGAKGQEGACQTQGTQVLVCRFPHMGLSRNEALAVPKSSQRRAEMVYFCFRKVIRLRDYYKKQPRLNLFMLVCYFQGNTVISKDQFSFFIVIYGLQLCLNVF